MKFEWYSFKERIPPQGAQIVVWEPGYGAYEILGYMHDPQSGRFDCFWAHLPL